MLKLNNDCTYTASQNLKNEKFTQNVTNLHRGKNETLGVGGGLRGGCISHVKRGLFLGRLSMLLCGNSTIRCVSIYL